MTLESADERAHQEEARNESLVSTVVNLAKKKRTKSQLEAMKKSAMVKETMSEFKQKSKKGTSLLMVQVEKKIME